MADCFWTDMVGVQQEHCGDVGLPGVMLSVNYGGYFQNDETSLEVYSIPCAQLALEEDTPLRPCEIPLQWARIVGGDVYTVVDTCDMLVEALDGSIDLHFNFNGFPKRVFSPSESRVGTPATHDLFWYTMFPDNPIDYPPKLTLGAYYIANTFQGSGFIRFAVETNVGNFDWWYISSGCY